MRKTNLYRPPRCFAVLKTDSLNFYKPITRRSRRPKLLQMGQTRHQSTPFYVYIQNIKLVWNSGKLYAGLEQENVLYTPLNTKSMVDHPNLRDQNHLKEDKRGINQLHSTCTFRISNCFGTLIYSGLNYRHVGKMEFVV